MLNIWIGDSSSCLDTPKAYFDNFLDDSLIDNDLTKDIVKRIDGSDFININLVISPVIGSISSKMISTTSKSLIILANTDLLIPLIYMGENAYPILGELSSSKDINIQMESFKCLFEYTKVDSIKILNDNSIVKSDMELVLKFREILG